MPFIGFVAIAVVLIIVWLWVNVALVRKSRQDEASRTRRTDQPQFRAEDNHTSSGHVRNETKPTLTAEEDGNAPPKATETPPAARVEDEDESGEDTATAGQDLVHDPEVFTPDMMEKRTVFGRNQAPFYFRNTADSPFYSDAWMKSFRNLSQDPKILGWIAFSGQTMGAADHQYDDDLVDVLKSYRMSLDKLRKEVGLNQVMESSVVGSEGKIWFFTGDEDIWFALFLEKTVDIGDIAVHLLPSAER